MEVLFKIWRQNTNEAGKMQSYSLEVEPGNTILDCLNKIKWELDGTLAFRKNCRNTICGSCAMRINGRGALACKENVGQEIEIYRTREITIAPLGNMPVIKDLVVDMSGFWNNLEEIEPYVSSKSRSVPEREFLQSPAEREQLNQTGNCIMCGACYSECNAVGVNKEFVGPHALAKSLRLVKDSRDDQTEARLEDYNQGTKGVWGCTRCYMCDAVCPMEVAPMEQISKIKQEILTRKETGTRAIRHRKLLINLVKQGGWIDERKFGLLLTSNYFRDLKGLLSIFPLGWKMLLSGKIPVKFEASEGQEQVRSLIEAVQNSSK
ncbi:succinate dehydrogenase/fumarate reductase iron-sulfur subunit [Gloeocapsa sp. PCC 73106]|uniref:succinate dehydrogenase/fumarate reductase iron-sulfur subunit n=1 Tax=Gloeocapsa sp. PCC 73106 TaxID=102232 RepID=UPI0002ACFCFC|nr:succinate dehydrogenase/fumarate reductase iron-sulfur subunit [Gloeocapsa sp. PCC 73106]ELR99645.1 succinate dehydrogenase and fumarate reductase iron-sulfur protein [Gloeocapsa sp. PCC 73106]